MQMWYAKTYLFLLNLFMQPNHNHPVKVFSLRKTSSESALSGGTGFGLTAEETLLSTYCSHTEDREQGGGCTLIHGH